MLVIGAAPSLLFMCPNISLTGRTEMERIHDDHFSKAQPRP